MPCEASPTAFKPEPQTLLTVIAATRWGSPPRSPAWRAGFWPRPACTTLPMMISSTCWGSIPARRTASATTLAPSSVADKGARPPWNFPMGLRTALKMTGCSMMSSPCGGPNATDGWWAAPRLRQGLGLSIGAARDAVNLVAGVGHYGKNSATPLPTAPRQPGAGTARHTSMRCDVDGVRGLMIPVPQSQSLELETLLHFIRVGYGARSLQHGRDQIGGESPDSACYYPPARRRLAGLVYNFDSVVISAHMSSSEHFQIGFARSVLAQTT